MRGEWTLQDRPAQDTVGAIDWQKYDIRGGLEAVDKWDILAGGEGPFPKADDVAETLGICIEDRDYGEARLRMLGRLQDGRYFFVDAECDTTGWDCQTSGRGYIGRDRAEVEMHMTAEDREDMKRYAAHVGAS